MPLTWDVNHLTLGCRQIHPKNSKHQSQTIDGNYRLTDNNNQNSRCQKHPLP